MSRPQGHDPLRHGRVELTLHRLRDGDGLPLLLLHELHGSSRDFGKASLRWPGPIHALDFAGHGVSGWLRGGAYTCELLAADADVALAKLGSAVLVGAGLGAWVALLLAGSRPEAVPAAVLLPGAGLHGGGDQPDHARFLYDLEAESNASRDVRNTRSDPRLEPCERSVRPSDYAVAFAAEARRLLLVEPDEPTPPWWRSVYESSRAERADDLANALHRIANAAASALSPREASTR